jgi:hypothetical protein
LRAIHCDWPAWPWSGCQPSSKRPQFWWRRPREWALAKRSLHSPQSNSADVAGLRAAARNRCEQVKLAALLNRCLACSSLGVDSAHGCMLRSAGTRQCPYPSTRPSEAVQPPQSSNRYQKIGSPPPFEGDKVCGLLLGCRSPAKNDKISPLLLFICIVLMKSLLTLNLAAMAPSPSIALKKSFPLLRAIGLSAGLVASTATASQVHAATSGTITATGTVPDACSVNGAQITMAKTSAKILSGAANNIAYTLQSGTTISLSKPTLVAPSGYGGEASVYAYKNQQLIAYSDSAYDYTQSYTANNVESGVFKYEVEVTGGISDVNLKPGNYTISTTLTCIGL